MRSRSGFDTTLLGTLLVSGLLCRPGSADAKGEGSGLASLCYASDALFAYAVGFGPVDPGAPSAVVVATNFGLLLSRDGGARYEWVCPAAYGQPLSGDFTLFALPGMAVLPDGRIVIVTGNVADYRVASADGCDFVRAPDPELQRAAVLSVASRPARPAAVFVATGFPGRGPHGVYRSQDGGDTFTLTDLTFDSRFAVGGVHLTGGALRLYAIATHAEELEAALWRSDTLGAGWIQAAATPPALAAGIAATDPLDSGRVLVDTVQDFPTVCGRDVTLLESVDGGDSFAVLQQRLGIPVGTVFGPDGEVWRGWVDGGIERLVAGQTPTALAGSPERVACLTTDPAGAPVTCPLEDPAAIVSIWRDGVGSFAPVVSLDRITGPASCPGDSTVGQLCAGAWAELAARWQLVPRDPGPTDPDDSAIPTGGGCTCRIDRARGGGSGGLALLALYAVPALALLLRRRARACATVRPR